MACDHFKFCKFAGGRDPQVGFWIQRRQNPKQHCALPSQHRGTARPVLREAKHTGSTPLLAFSHRKTDRFQFYAVQHALPHNQQRQTARRTNTVELHGFSSSKPNTPLLTTNSAKLLGVPTPWNCPASVLRSPPLVSLARNSAADAWQSKTSKALPSFS